jgi:hypothetical protein
LGRYHVAYPGVSKDYYEWVKSYVKITDFSYQRLAGRVFVSDSLGITLDISNLLWPTFHKIYPLGLLMPVCFEYLPKSKSLIGRIFGSKPKYMTLYYFNIARAALI